MATHQQTVRHTLRIDQWMTAVGSGETSLAYDDWLSGVLNALAPGPPEHAIWIVTREGKNEFRLQHRAR